MSEVITHVGPAVRERRDDGVYRVTRVVDDVPLWFEGSVPLVPSTEAIVGVLLVPALEGRRTIVCDEPLDERWLEGTGRLIRRLSEWWGYDPDREYIRHGGSRTESATPRPGGGLCFSAGVDSFYSLLHESDDITHLIFANGFDIPLREPERHADARATVERVAEAFERPLIHVSTNLRDHPAFYSAPWERTHGGALAALGHLLSDEIGHLRIASTLGGDTAECPWGSSPVTDPLWSSDRMRIIHGDVSISRMEKVLAIADDPVVLESLRVCYQDRDSLSNCSRCEKCLRTMLVLDMIGKLDDSPCFESGLDLPALVERVALVQPGYIDDWATCGARSPDAALRSAIDRLLQRSVGGARGKLLRALQRLRLRLRSA